MKSAATEVVNRSGQKIANLFVVLANFRFMIFLLIYSLYWIIFWQEFIIVPYYITDYISKDAPYEIVQSWAGAGAIILLQIPINRLTKNVPTHKAILIGLRRFISHLGDHRDCIRASRRSWRGSSLLRSAR